MGMTLKHVENELNRQIKVLDQTQSKRKVFGQEILNEGSANSIDFDRAIDPYSVDKRAVVARPSVSSHVHTHRDHGSYVPTEVSLQTAPASGRNS